MITYNLSAAKGNTQSSTIIWLSLNPSLSLTGASWHHPIANPLVSLPHQAMTKQASCLYTARYEFIHNRAHKIQPEEQTQVSEIIHYMSTLLPHLKKKLLKKLNTYHRPKLLREAMDITMDFEVEHQITQPES